MHSDKDTSIIDTQDQATLLALAHESITQGLAGGGEPWIVAGHYPASLQQQRASFVTLLIHGELRGCIGTLEAYQALVKDVAHNAYAAAFSDPRFMPLSRQEYEQLDIHISILNPKRELEFDSEQALIEQLRPGIDGLILQEGIHKATFLPSVWQQLPDATRFVRHLKQKAGLRADHWSKTLKAWSYTTTSFSD